MENFVFHNPTKLVFGKGTVEKIGEYLKKDGIRKVLMLYGGGSIKKNGVYEKVVRSLHDNGIEKVEVSGVRPNPVLSKVHEAIQVARENNVEAILAVGGGSVVDSAKAIAAGFYYDGDIWDAFIGKYNVKKALPLYVILTMSATGTEMNGNAVVTNEKTQEKFYFSSKHVYPVLSIVDPTTQYSLPANQVVYGAIDAISHVMEYYFDVAGSDLIDRIDEGIIKTLMETTEVILKEPENYEARANFCLATTLALNGLTGLGTTGGDWSSHELEHAISAFNPDIAHGAGLAIVFPAWMSYVKEQISEKLIKFGKNVFGMSGEFSPDDVINQLKSWYKKIGAPVTLKEVGINKEDIEKITQLANKHAPFGTVKELKMEDIRKIYEIAYE
ncbi:Fe-dependent oxidoreductase, alcohol dehydrogenase [Fervidobacterium pennivorans DSM 9078]|uniref:Fe-dependent oxidoreductase, alcohol dehydrogenase n=1 Tax=Fervidobacterium pennivorans (strain DSM 9078 / Ven5) TaxID=771875 RepID=H9UER4_FERPD|nr:iron-containing alcohol dehydrogenase [Fervidobacterium pennivorans]AFG36007.1 Fe-dependent oxidoreductase, alcohol dehydrogenase [Fervidobacterium pennivorans DSM 9078]